MTPFQELPPSIPRYETLTFTLPGDMPADPYDPGTTPIVTFTSLAGETLQVPAFRYQGFTRDLGVRGTPHWRVRFTPTEAGAWTV